MYTNQHSYLNPKIEVRYRDEHAGYALFCTAPIEEGELISVWSGRIVSLEALENLPEEYQRHTVQVEENCYMTSLTPDEPSDFGNHSCDPNAWLEGQIVLVARRPIAPGEEVCFDYATSDGTPYDEFTCACGSPICRGRITGDDWKRPELWERYAGHFSPYLQKRIDRLKAQKG